MSPSQTHTPSHSLRSDAAVHRGPPLRFLMDGLSIEAFAGESVAAALLAAGRREIRQSPRAGAPRGAFCFMGSCQECLVWVGARKLPSCQVPVSEGLVVESLAWREGRREEQSVESRRERSAGPPQASSAPSGGGGDTKCRAWGPHDF
ncbi:(2Fe-2S)-binding protein [Ottowia sp. VDI28]|uniref:(2Fe-2S)-binding protein n=1 Tax=Ottowia sp. VDI28 TaxID=3133968 RepID=UPI003C2E5B53